MSVAEVMAEVYNSVANGSAGGGSEKSCSIPIVDTIVNKTTDAVDTK
jgi:hypothetical protein